ncbi:hypothetical protein HDK77DRAFT_308873 [Phyllosticta capitalensis]|uniref:Uncharacterized protein n=1 Tax=Phyllosticta capitalensis TaxID=121624 RepID=A0ABR1YI50_9PEZI
MRHLPQRPCLRGPESPPLKVLWPHQLPASPYRVQLLLSSAAIFPKGPGAFCCSSAIFHRMPASHRHQQSSTRDMALATEKENTAGRFSWALIPPRSPDDPHVTLRRVEYSHRSGAAELDNDNIQRLSLTCKEINRQVKTVLVGSLRISLTSMNPALPLLVRSCVDNCRRHERPTTQGEAPYNQGSGWRRSPNQLGIGKAGKKAWRSCPILDPICSPSCPESNQCPLDWRLSRMFLYISSPRNRQPHGRPRPPSNLSVGRKPLQHFAENAIHGS